MCHKTNVYTISLALKIFEVDYVKYTTLSNVLVKKVKQWDMKWKGHDTTNCSSVRLS